MVSTTTTVPNSQPILPDTNRGLPTTGYQRGCHGTTGHRSRFRSSDRCENSLRCPCRHSTGRYALFARRSYHSTNPRRDSIASCVSPGTFAVDPDFRSSIGSRKPCGLRLPGAIVQTDLWTNSRRFSRSLRPDLLGWYRRFSYCHGCPRHFSG